MVKTAQNMVQTDAEKAALLLSVEELKMTVASQAHTIKLLQKALFGQKSEKVIDTDERQGVFEDILDEIEELNPDDIPAETLAEKDLEISSKQRRKRRSLQDLIPENLPREDVVVDLPEEQKKSSDGTPLKQIGEDLVEKLAYKPGHWFLKVFIYPKYANPADAVEGVKRAPAPDFAIPGGIFDESFYAWLIHDKCSLHLPHYRLEEQMKSAGIKIKRQTLCSCFIKAAEVLRPLHELMKNEIIKHGIIFTDETPVKQLAPGSGKTKKTYIWVYVGGGKAPPFRIFEFAQERNHKHPEKFLKNFKGYVHADAFSGYNPLFKNGEILECACWMHVRRKFFEAEDAPPEVRNLILRKIRNIYRYERVLKKYDPETQPAFILKIRKEKIEPIINDLFTMTSLALTQGLVMPKSAFTGAITYMHNLGQALKNFLDNPYLKPDNGESERALRPITIGRKNWMFLGSEKGGEAMGILMSIVQTCRAMNINVSAYLEDVLRRINAHPHSKLHELLPGNWEKLDSYYN
jgi:transposase